jgi:hypothetical protein
MGQLTEIFLKPIGTLRNAKKAIDDELYVSPSASAPDEATLERLWDSSDRHAEVARQLENLMSQFGADDVFHYEVELLRAEFESTKGEIQRRLLAREEPPPRPKVPELPASKSSAPEPPASKPQREQWRTFRPDGAVKVFHRDVRHLVQIVDVSSTDARLRHPRQLPADAWVTIRYLHLSIRARVVCSDDGFTELQFRTPLASEILGALREAARGNLGV